MEYGETGYRLRGVSRPTSKFIDGAARLATGVQEVDGIDTFLPSLLPLLLNREGRDEAALSESVPFGSWKNVR